MDPRSTSPRPARKPAAHATLRSTCAAAVLIAAIDLALTACSSTSSPPADGADTGVSPDAGDAGSTPDAAVDATSSTPDTDAAAPDATDAGTDATQEADAGAGTYVERVLSLELALKATQVDAGVPADAGDGGAQPVVSAVTTLTITARDGTTPVVTDLWLYTLDTQRNMTPLTAFTSTQARKSPRLMLPATIGGQPSGLRPANNGVANGTMTCACGSRGTLDQGAFVSGVTGTVVVTLAATPTTPILVVAAVEDERYAGAAAINPDGSPGAVPDGVGVPETHAWVSFSRDVAPLLKLTCGECHASTDPTSTAGGGVGPGYSANFYAVTGTADDLVNANFAINEQTLACETSYPDGGLPLAQCIQAITQAQFLVEPGAPADSDLLQRSRPDEDAGTSPEGLLWYGSRGARYSTKYGDRRMPSTTTSASADGGTWNNAPCYFDSNPDRFQVLFDWVAQGALSN